MEKLSGVPIFMYHRIIERNDPCYMYYEYAKSAITPKQFEDELNYISKNYLVISLQELVYRIKFNLKIPQGACVLTFDDGYKEHYNMAFGILRQYNMPATFFIIGDSYSGSGKSRWLDIFYQILASVQENEYASKLMKFANKYNIPHETNFSYVDIKKYIRSSETLKQKELIEDLSCVFDIEIDIGKTNAALYLSIDEIREMSTFGMSFGAHTMTHPDLGLLSIDKAKEEIIESRNFVVNLTGDTNIAFAYPYGGKSTYNKEIVDFITISNFFCACNTENDFNNHTTPIFELKRKVFGL